MPRRPDPMLLACCMALAAAPAVQAAGPDLAVVAAEIDRGRYAEAASALGEPDPADADALALRARLQEIAGQFDDALETLADATEARKKALPSVTSVDGANALAADHTRRGRLALTYGRLDAAEAEFRAAIRLVNDAHQRLHAQGIPHDEGDPRMFAGPATDGLARVYAAQGDARKAERTWRSVVARSNDPAVAFGFGAFYLAQGDSRNAERLFERGVRLAGEKPEHRRALARFLADQGRDLDRALALAEAALEGRDDVEGHDTLAWVLHRRGDRGRASEAAAKALRSGTADPTVLYHAGMIALADGRADEGRALLRRALEIHPNFDPRGAVEARKALGGPTN